MSLGQRVSPDSFVYREVERLYRIARSLRPAAADRWNRELYKTSLDTLGGLDPKTGVLRLSETRVLLHLTGSVLPGQMDDQAEALATVLHEATHGAMQIKAPGEPNAVWTEHSRGVMEGFAEVRTFVDFDAFADRAGYGGLTFGNPQYPGAFAATRDLVTHVTGPAYSRHALINDACRGPGLLHFDQFAHAVVANQLSELTHRDRPTQQAVRAQLIEPMLHNYWPTLPGASAATGQMVAREIRSDLDAKVDELRRHYRLPAGDQPTPASERQPTSSAARQDTLDGLRFLASQPSPTGAIIHRPQLGQGTRYATPTVNPTLARATRRSETEAGVHEDREWPRELVATPVDNFRGLTAPVDIVASSRRRTLKGPEWLSTSRDSTPSSRRHATSRRPIRPST